MLVGLGAEAVIGGHHEQRCIDLAGTHQHVADEPVVAGDIHEVQLGPVRQREVRIPDVDRHPPAALLGQSVGVDACKGAEERRLAVVDVAGRADDHGHRVATCLRGRRDCAGESLEWILEDRAEVEHDATLVHTCHHARRAPPERRHDSVRRPNRQRNAPGRKRLSGKRAAADRRSELD